MEALAPSIQQFLSIVSWVNELEISDAKLTDAARTLWALLTVAEDEGRPDLYDSTMQKLGRIGDLRGQIARELRTARLQSGLQVLAQE
jgi:hypothetical protein